MTDTQTYRHTHTHTHTDTQTGLVPGVNIFSNEMTEYEKGDPGSVQPRYEKNKQTNKYTKRIEHTIRNPYFCQVSVCLALSVDGERAD